MRPVGVPEIWFWCISTLLWCSPGLSDVIRYANTLVLPSSWVTSECFCNGPAELDSDVSHWLIEVAFLPPNSSIYWRSWNGKVWKTRRAVHFFMLWLADSQHWPFFEVLIELETSIDTLELRRGYSQLCVVFSRGTGPLPCCNVGTHHETFIWLRESLCICFFLSTELVAWACLGVLSLVVVNGPGISKAGTLFDCLWKWCCRDNVSCRYFLWFVVMWIPSTYRASAFESGISPWRPIMPNWVMYSFFALNWI